MPMRWSIGEQLRTSKTRALAKKAENPDLADVFAMPERPSVLRHPFHPTCVERKAERVTGSACPY
jgi:hypothetical protein